jgi:hypothetical protein
MGAMFEANSWVELMSVSDVIDIRVLKWAMNHVRHSPAEAASRVARAFGVRGLDPAFPFRAGDRRISRDGAVSNDVRRSPGNIALTFQAARVESQSGVKPPHSKALPRTFHASLVANA